MIARALIAAAGEGRRLGADVPKALVELGGVPLFVHSLLSFERAGMLDGAVVLAPPAHAGAVQEIIGSRFPEHEITIVPGGRTRQESVWNGLCVVPSDSYVIAIHDAARPFTPPSAIRASVDAAAAYGAATVAIPCSDTVLEADENSFLNRTPDRSRLWQCQTPQSFRLDVIKAAYVNARAKDLTATDDATLVRRNGGTVKLVDGSPYNFKITLPEDLRLAEAMVASGAFDTRGDHSSGFSDRTWL